MEIFNKITWILIVALTGFLVFSGIVDAVNSEETKPPLVLDEQRDELVAKWTIPNTEPNLLIWADSNTFTFVGTPNLKHDDHCPTQFGSDLSCVSDQGEVAITCKNGFLEVTGDISIFVNVVYDYFMHKQTIGEVHKKPVIFKELAVTE